MIRIQHVAQKANAANQFKKALDGLDCRDEKALKARLKSSCARALQIQSPKQENPHAKQRWV